ncbi:hypothetical protein [Bifidobacterium dentium]|uniref:hypothetical protein n=1 Tax=Bifidobacterium dentium TaxID=1689 RepID=UPI001F50B0BF|nr:hypothetical protein [Bifidobacterium dentium]
MLNNIVITDEERKLFLSWTALDEDLAEVEPDLAEAVLRSRLDFARGTYREPTTGMIPKESTSSKTCHTLMTEPVHTDLTCTCPTTV